MFDRIDEEKLVDTVEISISSFLNTQKLISLRAIPTFLDRQIKFFFRSLLNQVINTAESWTVRELKCALNNCYKVEVQQRDKPRASDQIISCSHQPKFSRHHTHIAVDQFQDPRKANK